MASLKHRFEHLVVWGAMLKARLLPARCADWMAAFLGTVAYYVLTSRRRLAIENLHRAFGGLYSNAQTRGLARRVFRNIGRTFVELARTPKLGEAGLKAGIVEAGREHILHAHGEGNGQIVVTAHFGNWERLGMWAGLQGIETGFMVYRQHNLLVNNLVNRLRVSLCGSIIEVPTQTKEVFRVLRRNGLVVMVCDQHAAAETLVMDFLGRPAAVARGPALFAVRCGCPIIPFVMVRERFDRHIIKSGEPIYPPGSGDEDADIRAMTAAWVNFFEKWIREYPDQWMWTHNRWKVIDLAPHSA